MEGPMPVNGAGEPKRARSPLARYLDEAFAGCDVWTVVPGRKRASAAGLAPPDWVSGNTAGPDRPAAAG